jgi:hypothetical protein
VVERFLARYLRRWDGNANAAVIFTLIETLHPCAYEDIYANLFRPIARLYFTSDVKFKVSTAVANCLNSWYID